MAKPNYSFEKRRKELARKNKKEEKAQRKREKDDVPTQDAEPANVEQVPPSPS